MLGDPPPIEPDELPWWLGAGIAALMAVVAIAAADEAWNGHKPEVAALLAVAVAPWLLNVVPGWQVPKGVHALVTLPALAVVTIGGHAWEWTNPSIDSQVSLMIAVWLVGETTAVAARGVVIGTFLGGVLIIVGRALVDEHFEIDNPWTVAIFIAFGAGILIRLLLTAIGDLRAAQAQLEIEAVRGERQRIAREVHDVVAHSLTVSMLHVTAARMAVGRGDDRAAVEALEEAERAGRTSLRDIRRTIGLLRDGTADATAAPEPDAGDLGGLVDSWRSAGMVIDLHVSGPIDHVGGSVGLAVYRVVQESLANAGRHLPGAENTVRLSADEASIEVVVSSTGVTAGAVGDGHGLLGMRERVESLDGSLEAGPTSDGWRVAARIPLSSPAASALAP